jgi:hypothetical protein
MSQTSRSIVNALRLTLRAQPRSMSMMRRSGIGSFDALQFQRFHRGRLALDFFLQALQQFVLRGHHVVQLLDLMFEVGDVRFEFLHPPGQFICHEKILPACRREVEASLALRCG